MSRFSTAAVMLSAGCVVLGLMFALPTAMWHDRAGREPQAVRALRRVSLVLLTVSLAGSLLGAPCLIPVLIVVLPLVAGAHIARRERHEGLLQLRAICLSCGYDLRGSSVRCPECGARIPGHAVAPRDDDGPAERDQG